MTLCPEVVSRGGRCISAISLGLHHREAATAAGVGAGGCVRSVRLVVQAAHVRNPPGVAEDTRGDPFPAKLALIAERGDALGARREGGELVFEPALFLDRRQPVHTLGSHGRVDLIGRAARATLLAHLLTIRGVNARADCWVEALGELAARPRVAQAYERTDRQPPRH